ncbi:hypothetical protein OG216_47895 (plasmid) [Streptomycetaceae bacterium NBC_01309]
MYLRSQLHLADGLCSWACVCGAGRTGNDGGELRQERLDHMPVCGAKFTRTDELPLAIVRPGWYLVADELPCVLCGEGTDVRSPKRKPCHVECADSWTAARDSNHQSQQAPRVAVPTRTTTAKGSPTAKSPDAPSAGAPLTASSLQPVTRFNRQVDPGSQPTTARLSSDRAARQAAVSRIQERVVLR